MIPSEKTVDEIIAFFYYNDFDLHEFSNELHLQKGSVWFIIGKEQNIVQLNRTVCYQWNDTAIRNSSIIYMFKKRKDEQKEEKIKIKEELARKKLKMILKYQWLLKLFK